jgi:transcriptional regulator with XRE-family HTH domain
MNLSDEDFARVFGDALKAHLDRLGIEYAAAAPRLGVTKSALSTYWSDDGSGKRRKPRAALLFKACSEFDFTFEYKGFRISADALENRGRKEAHPKYEQLILDYQRQFKLAEDDGNVSVRLRRAQGRIALSVSLKAVS